MPNSYKIAECKSKDQWNDFVYKHGTIHHLFEWSYVNRDTFGSPCINLACFDGDDIVAIYPYIVRGKWPLKWYVSPTDFGGGPIGEPEAVKELIAEVKRRGKKERIAMNTVRYCEENINGFNGSIYEVIPRRNLVIDLNRSEDEIWRSFQSKVRNSIKKSRSQKILVEEAKESDLDIYLDLVKKHSASVGYRPRSERFIRSLFKYLDTTLLVTRWHNDAVGGCVYLNFNGRAHAINASRDPDKPKLRIGEAMHWGGLSHFREKTFLEYDFMSRNDNIIKDAETCVYPSHINLHRFKKGWRPKEEIHNDLQLTLSQKAAYLRKLLARSRDHIAYLKGKVTNHKK